MYLFKIKVKLKRIPFDMMRYDNCVPETQEDVKKLESIAFNRTLPQAIEVNFRMYSANKEDPTIDRWKSFGCEIVSISKAEKL